MFVTFGRWFRSRRSRGWTLASLGPNEARILYDVAIGVGALGGCLIFQAFWPSAPTGMRWWTHPALFAMPGLLVACNAILGIYTRLKLAPLRSKLLALASAVTLACASSFLLGAPAAAVVLWGFLVAPPVVLARVLVAVPFAKHSSLVTTLVVNRHGPVVVLGGAGYIGCHTVALLLQKGYGVRVLDRLMYGRGPLSELERHPRFELIEGDVTEITKLTGALRNASAVVHLAGLVGDPACALDPGFTRHTNIVATRMAKEVAQSLGVYRFVFASSCSVYGLSATEVSEQSPVHPVSLYAETKVDSERELLHAVRDDFFVTILRFATVFGHSRRPRFDLVANLFTAQAMTEGLVNVIGPEQWRPLVHVRDLARAIVLVLESPPAIVQSQVYNVGDARLNTTIGRLAELVCRVAGEFRSGIRLAIKEQDPQDRRNYMVSFEKIRGQLGFETATDLETGIREMARLFAEGGYSDYANHLYSNVATTRDAVQGFYDPLNAERLYGPLKVV